MFIYYRVSLHPCKGKNVGWVLFFSIPFRHKVPGVCYTWDMTHQPWNTKIVGYGTVEVDQILANPRNYRIHTRAQQEALAAVLSDVGIIQNLIINQRTSEDWPADDRHVETLIDGHCRVMLALRAGQPTLPVTYVDLTPQEEYTALATLDPIASMAGMDMELYTALAGEVVSTTTNTTLAAFLTSMVEDTPGKAPRTAQEARTPQEVSCPSCGCCFVPMKDGEG